MKLILTIFLTLLLISANCWEEDNQIELEQVDHCETYEDVQETNCTKCFDGYYLKENQCPGCEQTIINCTLCKYKEPNVQCYKCIDGQFPSSNSSECLECNQVIQHCSECETPKDENSQTTCNKCDEGYDLSDDKLKCEEGSSSKTIIIVSAVVGAVVLVGAGFAIFKCMKKKRGSRLLEDEQ